MQDVSVHRFDGRRIWASTAPVYRLATALVYILEYLFIFHVGDGIAWQAAGIWSQDASEEDCSASTAFSKTCGQQMNSSNQQELYPLLRAAEELTKLQ